MGSPNHYYFIIFISDVCDQGIRQNHKKGVRWMSAVSSNDINSISEIPLPSDSIQINTSGMEEVLLEIKESVQELSQNLFTDDILLASLSVDSESSDIGGYWFSYSGETVYIPVDQVDFIDRTANNLINLSSQTITCIALDSNGNHGHTYRFSSFGTPQRYESYTSGGNTYWHWVSIVPSDDNLITGQPIGHYIPNVVNIAIIFALIFMFLKVRK